jgi:hypothetical protein
MFDPLAILIVFSGGIFVGFFEGLTRRRSFLAVVTNVIVGGIFGTYATFILEPIGRALAWISPTLDHSSIFAALLGLTIYVVPFVGGYFGVAILLGILRRERLSLVGKIFGVSIAVLVLIAIYSHMVHTREMRTTKYMQLSSYTPITLNPRDMAGMEKVTLALTSGLAKEGIIVTPPSQAIADAVPTTSVGRRYRLRIINGTRSDFAWTMTPGPGVTLKDEMTIAPNTWRDFDVNLDTLDDVSIESIATGACKFQDDPGGCQIPISLLSLF